MSNALETPVKRNLAVMSGQEEQTDVTVKRAKRGPRRNNPARARRGQKTHLLDLPNEILNMIYKFVIPSGQEMRVTLIRKLRQPCAIRRDINAFNIATTPALAQVNRKIRRDVLKMFYACNKFTMAIGARLKVLKTWSYIPLVNDKDLDAISDWCSALTTDKFSSISSFSVRNQQRSQFRDDWYLDFFINMTARTSTGAPLPQWQVHGACASTYSIATRWSKFEAKARETLMTAQPCIIDAGDTGLRRWHIARIIRLAILNRVIPFCLKKAKDLQAG